MSNGICKTEGCDLDALVRGYCQKHYTAAYRRGELPKRYGIRPTCGVEGCEGVTQSLNLCGLHYNRFRKYGDPLYVKTRTDKRVIPNETSPTRLAKLLGVSRQRAHQLLNRQAHTARLAVQQALKAGTLIKSEFCERCGAGSDHIEAHHWDYHEELDVRWVCPKCHTEIHCNIRRGTNAL